MAKYNTGDHVTLLDLPGQMREFAGKTGRVVGTEKCGELYYRVRLDDPVFINGVGKVTDDLWTARFLRKVREPKRVLH